MTYFSFSCFPIGQLTIELITLMKWNDNEVQYLVGFLVWTDLVQKINSTWQQLENKFDSIVDYGITYVEADMMFVNIFTPPDLLAKILHLHRKSA